MVQELTDGYIRERYGAGLSQDDVNSVKLAMQRYKTRWWESTDPVEIAKHQVFEDYMLVDFSIYQSSVEKVIGRTIHSLELILNKYKIQQEIINAVITSEEKTLDETLQ